MVSYVEMALWILGYRITSILGYFLVVRPTIPLYCLDWIFIDDQASPAMRGVASVLGMLVFAVLGCIGIG
jgi:hypothetical protein